MQSHPFSPYINPIGSATVLVERVGNLKAFLNIIILLNPIHTWLGFQNELTRDLIAAACKLLEVILFSHLLLMG